MFVVVNFYMVYFVYIHEKIIHATLRRYPLLGSSIFRVKAVYAVLKKIKIVASKGSYRPLSGGFKLMFLRTTNPNKLEEGDNNIPFEFIRPDMINVRIKDKDILLGIFFPYKILLIYMCVLPRS